MKGHYGSTPDTHAEKLLAETCRRLDKSQQHVRSLREIVKRQAKALEGGATPGHKHRIELEQAQMRIKELESLNESYLAKMDKMLRGDWVRPQDAANGLVGLVPESRL